MLLNGKSKMFKKEIKCANSELPTTVVLTLTAINITKERITLISLSSLGKFIHFESPKFCTYKRECTAQVCENVIEHLPKHPTEQKKFK